MSFTLLYLMDMFFSFFLMENMKTYEPRPVEPRPLGNRFDSWEY